MKRFLILFTLIAFVTVSCAGPNKARAGWTKPDFRQDQFENDRRECIDSIGKNLDSEDFGKALEECLEKEGYAYQTPQEAEKTKEKSTTKEQIKTAGKTAGMVLLGVMAVTLYAAYIGLMFLPRK